MRLGTSAQSVTLAKVLVSRHRLCLVEDSIREVIEIFDLNGTNLHSVTADAEWRLGVAFGGPFASISCWTLVENGEQLRLFIVADLDAREKSQLQRGICCVKMQRARTLKIIDPTVSDFEPVDCLESEVACSSETSLLFNRSDVITEEDRFKRPTIRSLTECPGRLLIIDKANTNVKEAHVQTECGSQSAARIRTLKQFDADSERVSAVHALSEQEILVVINCAVFHCFDAALSRERYSVRFASESDATRHQNAIPLSTRPQQLVIAVNASNLLFEFGMRGRSSQLILKRKLRFKNAVVCFAMCDSESGRFAFSMQLQTRARKFVFVITRDTVVRKRCPPKVRPYDPQWSMNALALHGSLCVISTRDNRLLIFDVDKSRAICCLKDVVVGYLFVSRSRQDQNATGNLEITFDGLKGSEASIFRVNISIQTLNTEFGASRITAAKRAKRYTCAGFEQTTPELEAYRSRAEQLDVSPE